MCTPQKDAKTDILDQNTDRLDASFKYKSEKCNLLKLKIQTLDLTRTLCTDLPNKLVRKVRHEHVYLAIRILEVKL